jgi:hypothetical protein
MVFKVKGKEELDDAIKVRLSKVEKQTLIEEADIAGISMSELVRRRYFGKPIIADTDAVMLRELRRQGGLLKHTNFITGGRFDAEITSAIKSMQLTFERISSGVMS